MIGAQVLVGGLRGLRIGVKAGLVLLEELLLDCNVVVGDAEHGQTVFRLLGVGALFVSYLGDQLVLDKDERLHRMLEGQLVLVHLTQDGANVEVDVCRVQDLQAVINRLIGEVQIIVLDLQGLLEVREGGAELLRAAEDASEVVVSHGAVLVSFLREALGFSEQFEGDLEILCEWSGVFNLPFWRKLIDRMLQIMAAS